MSDEWRYEPARDHGLAAGERLRSIEREPGLISHTISRSCWACLRGYLRLVQRLKVEGAERIPTAPPVILVANHTSHLDALVLAAAAPRPIRNVLFPVAAGDAFFDTKSSALFASVALNALPLWRTRCGRQSLQSLRGRLVDGGCACILFPEGTRSRTGELGTFKAGVGMLAAGTDIPVVPCYIAGAYEAWPPSSKVPRRGKVIVRVGEPLRFAATSNARSGWQDVAGRLREAVAQLAEEKITSPAR